LQWFHALYEGREDFSSREEELAYREAQSYITEGEARDIAVLLGLRPGHRVVDLFCGNGRHAVCLARMRLKAFGVDIARSRVKFASRWAKEEGLEAFFLMGDGTRLPLRGPVDAVMILGGSFSHLGLWERDVETLSAVRGILAPGGMLLVDNPNPVRFWKMRNEGRELIAPEDLPWFDFPLFGPKGCGKVRYWGAKAMRDMMMQAGYSEVTIYGDRKGGPYGGNSPRLMVLARNPG
jgi:SAM-dependent methyltransferase